MPKTDLKNRIIMEDGNVILTSEGVIESFYSGNFGNLVCVNNEVDEYNKLARLFEFEQISKTNPEIDHKSRSRNWKMPQKYKDLDVQEYILSLCSSDDEKERVLSELVLFQEREMYDVLKYLIYLVDFMRERNIVWGVGRGSSVSSYCLYLIGIHKINSLKFNLDIREFLK